VNVMDEYKKVPLSLIVWKSSIREFTDEDVENMAASLRVHSQIEPIIVKPLNKQGLYEGVCGKLRFEGLKHAKIPNALTRIHKFKSEDEVLEWQLVENLHRKNLTTLQRAEAYKKLYDLRRKELGGVKDKSIVNGIAESIEKQTGEKKAEKTIYRYIQVAKELPKKLKAKIRIDTNFGMAHAIQFLRLKNKPEAQLELAEKLRHKPMTVKNLKKEVDLRLKPKPKPQVNSLNELTGGEWLQFTKSWFIFDALQSDLNEERIISVGLSEQHPATFSPTMVSEFVRFFTKKGEVVLDPFVGIGSTLVACSRAGRRGIGIDINKGYVEIAKKRIAEDPNQTVIHGNAWEIEDLNLPYNPINYCITSPPYHRMLEKVDRKQKVRMEKSLDINYSQPIALPNTVGEYIEKLVELFSKIANFTKKGGFLTVILQNFWDEGGMVPLAWQFTIAMIERGDWTFKGERVWCQAHKKLLPYGQKFDFMPNVHHHYCLVFRK